jgi:hypothetical protein
VSKPFGTVCTLCPFDWSAEREDAPEVGHYIRSTGGSCYLIIEARLVRGHERRYRLTCVRTDPAQMPADATVHALRWYPRSKQPVK